MDKAELKARIRAIEPALRRGGLEELGLFGSFARGDQTPESDVDLLYTFENGQASLQRLVDLGTLLEETLGRRVDLVPRAFLHPAFREEVLAEREPIFEPLPAARLRTIDRIRHQFYTMEELQQQFSEAGIEMPRQTIISRCKHSRRNRLEAVRLEPNHQRSPWLILRESGDAWIRRAVTRKWLASCSTQTAS